MKPHTRLWMRRVAWLLALWGGSVFVLFLVAQLLKSIMRNSGMG